MIARIVGAILFGTLVLCMLVAPSATAARWSPIMVSSDGKSWSSNLTRPIFGKKVDLVPGDRVARTFWVRNQSNRPARLEVLVRPDRPQDLKLARRFHLAVKHVGGWHGTRDGAEKVRLAPGAAVPITVRVHLGRRADGSTRDKTLGFHLELRMTGLRKGR